MRVNVSKTATTSQFSLFIYIFFGRRHELLHQLLHMRGPPLVLSRVLPGVFLHSRVTTPLQSDWSLSCHHVLVLCELMREQQQQRAFYLKYTPAVRWRWGILCTFSYYCSFIPVSIKSNHLAENGILLGSHRSRGSASRFFTFLIYIFGGGMNCFISYGIRVDNLWFACVYFWGIPPLQSDWSLSRDHVLCELK